MLDSGAGQRLRVISATPPVDMLTGEMVRGDIETQTEASLKALKHCLEAAGTTLDKVVMVLSTPRLLQRHQPGLCEVFCDQPAGAQLRAGGVVADRI
ncbi:hypothetical protein MPL1032_340005 [Mesorhizobium plurifarium]|uniref:Uncharacterized protein n=1 Tax=Mesorhizobium plurifarium TaxID=69974 RepID=A0A0K2W4P2_MESPL|nr:hypothetical protein MPL1032_340005 [Mesorhizobium plurifarium]